MTGRADEFSPPLVETLEDARKWIVILWRWACDDAEELAALREALATQEASDD